MQVTLNTDGGISPGPSFGFVVRDAQGEIVHKQGGRLDEGTTSNEAEYSALLAGLYCCEHLGATHVKVLADSQVMIRQLKGQYVVRAENLKPFYIEAKRQCADAFEKVTFKHIPREENTIADGLGREAWEERWQQ